MQYKYGFPALAIPALLTAVPQQAGGNIPLGWLILWIVVFIAVIIFWIVLDNRKGKTRTQKPENTEDAAAQRGAEPMAAVRTAPPLAEETLSIAPGVEALSIQSEEVATVAETAETPAPPKPDDLEIVEGIGPKIASILNQNGIFTFAQLSCAEVGDLRKMMQAAGLRLAEPATWPAQASLAADGKMDELKTLQDQLKGGREA